MHISDLHTLCGDFQHFYDNIKGQETITNPIVNAFFQEAPTAEPHWESESAAKYEQFARAWIIPPPPAEPHWESESTAKYEQFARTRIIPPPPAEPHWESQRTQNTSE